MLTRLRNAVHARHQRVDVPASRFKVEIARILEEEGYIHGFRVLESADAADRQPATDAAPSATAKPSVKSRVIRIFLKYGPRGENVISGLQRVSRPGRRVYLGRADVPKVMGGLGTSILTTSRGVMTGKDAAKAGVGGEVLCNVW
jgi:small subunit ribosomal protein S8